MHDAGNSEAAVEGEHFVAFERVGVAGVVCGDEWIDVWAIAACGFDPGAVVRGEDDEGVLEEV